MQRAYENTRFYRAESTLLLFLEFGFLLVFCRKSLDAQNFIKNHAHIYIIIKKCLLLYQPLRSKTGTAPRSRSRKFSLRRSDRTFIVFLRRVVDRGRVLRRPGDFFFCIWEWGFFCAKDSESRTEREKARARPL